MCNSFCFFNMLKAAMEPVAMDHQWEHFCFLEVLKWLLIV